MNDSRDEPLYEEPKTLLETISKKERILGVQKVSMGMLFIIMPSVVIIWALVTDLVKDAPQFSAVFMLVVVQFIGIIFTEWGVLNLRNAKNSEPSRIYKNGIEFRLGGKSFLKFEDIRLIKAVYDEKKERNKLLIKDKQGTKYFFSDSLIRNPRSVFVEDLSMVKKILEERASNAKWMGDE